MKTKCFYPSLHLYSGCFSARRLFFRRFDFLKQQTTVKQEAFLRKQLPETVSENESATTASFASLEKRICLSSRTALMKPCSRRASAGYSFEEPNVIVNPLRQFSADCCRCLPHGQRAWRHGHRQRKDEKMTLPELSELRRIILSRSTGCTMAIRQK